MLANCCLHSVKCESARRGLLCDCENFANLRLKLYPVLVEGRLLAVVLVEGDDAGVTRQAEVQGAADVLLCRQCVTVQYSAIQCNSVQYSTAPAVPT